MYSKEEKKSLRIEFWQKFKVYSNKRRLRLKNPGGWLMDNTEIKQLNLKFDFTETEALVAIDIDTKNLDKRILLWEKLEGLKAIIVEKIPDNVVWEFDYSISESKTISRIYVKLTDVSIYNKTCWKQVFSFFFANMYPLEQIVIEYKDYFKNN